MFRNLGMPQRSGAWASAVAFAAAAALGPLPATAQTGGDGPDLLVETYRDWVVRCAPVAPAQGVAPAADAQPPARLCEIAQELGQADSGQRVLQLAFQADGDGARTPQRTLRSCLNLKPLELTVRQGPTHLFR